MKLQSKLPLAFALSLALVLGGALIGIYRLNQAVGIFQNDVLRHVAGHKKGAEISAHFLSAVQKWKNVLLRGKDAQELEKYWAAHVQEMQAVSKGLQELDALVDKGSTSQKLAIQLGQEIQAAQTGYYQAVEAYKTSGNDFAAGDAASKGTDRAATATLLALQEELSKEEQHATEGAHLEANSATRTALIIMTLVTIFSLVGATRLSRRIVGELGSAVKLAKQVAQGDLTHQTAACQGDDEIAELLTALQGMQNQLVALVRDVRQGAQSVANASSEIAQGNNDLSARTEQQASALQQTSSSMAQLNSTASQSTDSARQANQLANNASSVAIQGGK